MAPTGPEATAAQDTAAQDTAAQDTAAQAGAVQVQFTIDDATRGAAIADVLLQDGLASCVQRFGPVRSRYRWQGSIEEAEEWLFLCKTTTARLDELIERVRAAHPYDTPEILATEVVAGLDRYLQWNADETSPHAARRDGPA